MPFRGVYFMTNDVLNGLNPYKREAGYRGLVRVCRRVADGA